MLVAAVHTTLPSRRLVPYFCDDIDYTCPRKKVLGIQLSLRCSPVVVPVAGLNNRNRFDSLPSTVNNTRGIDERVREKSPVGTR